ncbi:hypothetical protein Avbf_08025 [Armadillidium vulgare]|nr:hypothetical protein Avbf_08025 [Armadillidium vulgare]
MAQVFHVCHADHRKDSFLCPNGTIFHQLRLVCDWWYNVDCSSSDLHVSVNNDIGKFTPRQKVGRVSINNDIDRAMLFRERNRGFERRPFDAQSDFGLNIHTNEFDTTVRPHNDRIRDSFGVSLQTISNVGTNAIDNNFNTFTRTEKPPGLHSLQFPPSLQTLSQTFAPFSPTTPTPFITRKFESSSFGVPLRTTNVTPRTSFLTSPARDFSSPPKVNRILSSAPPKFGVDLPLISNSLRDFRDDSFVLFDNKNAFVSTGVPLPPIQNLHDAIVPPEHFTVPKPKPPSRTFTNQNSFGGRDTTERVSNARRVKVNKRPISTSIQGELPKIDQNFGSRNHFRVNLNRISGIDSDEVVILDDDKISTQFFNLGTPRRVTNRRPFSTPVGRPLPTLDIQTNNDRREDTFGRPLQSANINNNNQNDLLRHTIGVPLPPASIISNVNANDRREDSFGRPLQSTNFSPNNQNDILRNNIGIPLPPVSTTSNLNSNQLNDNFGITLSEANQRARNHFRTSDGRPHPVFNRITTGRNNAIDSSFRLSSSREFDHNNQRSSINANRGSTTFLNSQRNRASIQNLLNRQVVGTAVAGGRPSTGLTMVLNNMKDMLKNWRSNRNLEKKNDTVTILTLKEAKLVDIQTVTNILAIHINLKKKIFVPFK